MEGTLTEATVPSTNVPSQAPRHGAANAVPITYYLPKNYDANRKGADHVGASLVPRSLDAFAFIGRQLKPPKWIDDTVLRFRASADQNKKARGYPVTPFDPNRIHAE